ncbi:Enoyl-CoA hydratase/carnithine racemase [Frankineae bacterium MT45]|nr:Enoyl-CoA hydratase/carnithine racemase [Frankineae bacterium MT45]
MSSSTPVTDTATEATVTLERRGHVLLIGLNRPAKRNAVNVEMWDALAQAYGELERDDDLWAGVVFAHGPHFTAGFDLAEIAPRIQDGTLGIPEGGADPWNLREPLRRKPIVAAVHGMCLTLGIELLLASDIRISADDAKFGQIEVARGIYPFLGATVRMPQVAGWGNAMRWLLTGDLFDAEEALRLGLVQEVVPAGEQLAKAIEIADRICAQAPLGVQATIRSARGVIRDGEEAAIAALLEDAVTLFGTEDAAEGVASFVERRTAKFSGR